jgi:hypothetical protein
VAAAVAAKYGVSKADLLESGRGGIENNLSTDVELHPASSTRLYEHSPGR